MRDALKTPLMILDAGRSGMLAAFNARHVGTSVAMLRKCLPVPDGASRACTSSSWLRVEELPACRHKARDGLEQRVANRVAPRRQDRLAGDDSRGDACNGACTRCTMRPLCVATSRSMIGSGMVLGTGIRPPPRDS